MSGKTTFEQLYQAQAIFQCKVEGKMPVDEPVKFQYHMNAMTEELGEVLKADKRWKTHRNTTFIPAEKLDELADVFITAMNISLWSGFSADQIMDAIANKIVENNKRKDSEE
jgi:NTP pyrophosphatase (non-canonical NTP hydrolase)